MPIGVHCILTISKFIVTSHVAAPRVEQESDSHENHPPAEPLKRQYLEGPYAAILGISRDIAQ